MTIGHDYFSALYFLFSVRLPWFTMANVNFSTSSNFTQNDSSQNESSIPDSNQQANGLGTIKQQLTIEALSEFTGTSNYFKHPFLGNKFVYTDGVWYVARTGRCYWLIDEIAFLLPRLLKTCPSEFYCIVVTVNEDRSAEIVINDGNENVITKRKIARTDLQIEGGEIILYLTGYGYSENGAPKYCLMLSSEY